MALKWLFTCVAKHVEKGEMSHLIKNGKFIQKH